MASAEILISFLIRICDVANSNVIWNFVITNWYLSCIDFSNRNRCVLCIQYYNQWLEDETFVWVFLAFCNALYNFYRTFTMYSHLWDYGLWSMAHVLPIHCTTAFPREEGVILLTVGMFKRSRTCKMVSHLMEVVSFPHSNYISN